MQISQDKLPLLTILIPTYNRAARVKPLVEYLLPAIERFGGEIELVVSNNKSEDDTAELLAPISSSNFRLHNRGVHLGSTEENMFASVDLCRGSYVWFLGDDDVPFLDTLGPALDLLRDRQADVFIFNSPIVTSHGGKIVGWTVPLSSDLVEVDFTAGACLAGYTSGFAGISHAIIKREPLTLADWRPAREIMPIYSHVAWWMIAFKGGRLAAINRPLVSYLLDDAADISARYSRYSETIGVKDRQFWTVGLVGHLSYLQRIGAVSSRDIFSMYETTNSGDLSTRYRLLDHILVEFYNQAVLSVEGDDARNELSDTEIQGFADWILAIDPGYFGCVRVLRWIVSLRAAVEEGDRRSASGRDVRQGGDGLDLLKERFRSAFAETCHAGDVRVDLIGRLLGYDLYAHVSGKFAAFPDHSEQRQQVLRRFDLPMTGTVIVAENEAELRSTILARATRLAELDKVLLPRAIRETLDVAWSAANALAGINRRTDERDARHAFAAAIRTFDAVVTRPGFRNWLLLPRHRIPDPPGFDRVFYVRTNPDVAASGMDPLQHFLDVGWREGRDPSAVFQVRGYLDANPDVEAANVNPLLHFNSFRPPGTAGWVVLRPTG